MLVCVCRCVVVPGKGWRFEADVRWPMLKLRKPSQYLVGLSGQPPVALVRAFFTIAGILLELTRVSQNAVYEEGLMQCLRRTEGGSMLVLTRRAGESIMIDDKIELKVLKIRGSQVHLGIEAPRQAAVHRKEVWLRIQDDQARGGESEEANPLATPNANLLAQK